MKGVLLQYTAALGTAAPNIIAFQFNPETLRRTWTQPSGAGGNPLGVPGDPGEAYALTLMLDSTDVVARDARVPVAAAALAGGLGPSIAALETLMFPPTVGKPQGKPPRSTPSAQLPAVMFAWGIGRILPVRITTLSITESLFDAKLNPTHATVELGFRVMTLTELKKVTGPFKGIGIIAYENSRIQRGTLALSHLATTAGSFTLPPMQGV